MIKSDRADAASVQTVLKLLIRWSIRFQAVKGSASHAPTATLAGEQEAQEIVT